MKSTIHKILLLTGLLLLVVLLTPACSKKSREADITVTDQPEVWITPTVDKDIDISAAPSPTVSDISEGDKSTPTVSAVTSGNVDTPTAGAASSDNKSTPAKSTDTSGVGNTPTGSTNTSKIIAIDAGHQSKGDYDKEPIGPGSDIFKTKVSSGTQGAFTGVPEYKLNLVIADKLKEELINRGYEVVIIREKNDVNLSNIERAKIANESGADLFIRIHADGSTNSAVNGTSTLYPSSKNPYVSDLSDASYNLAKAIVDSISESTGSKDRGAIARDDMSGINWSKIPVTIIEMGYMTNEKEDRLMQTEDYQDKIVEGICDGIDHYFE